MPCLFSNTNKCYLSALAGVKEVQKENVVTQMNYCLWSLPSCAKKKYHSVEMCLLKGAVIYWQYKHDYVLAHCCVKQTIHSGEGKKCDHDITKNCNVPWYLQKKNIGLIEIANIRNSSTQSFISTFISWSLWKKELR